VPEFKTVLTVAVALTVKSAPGSKASEVAKKRMGSVLTVSVVAVAVPMVSEELPSNATFPAVISVGVVGAVRKVARYSGSKYVVLNH
jgi:hypothetical protein